MPSKLRKAIGAVKDQTSISLAKVASNNTSNLEVAVLKATTHDDVPMDDRYVCEIVQLVSSSKIYAAACARAIGKRISRTRNWIVALKSLMLVLRIFQDGDPYFPREVLHAMKRGAKILNLSSFRNDSNSSPWDFTAFVRTFALYLDERLECFLTGKLQRRYTCIRDKESISHRSRGPNEPVRDMKPAMLLDRISYWQRLLERAIATRPTGVAKTNRLVQICLYAIVQESFDFYKDISDGLALLLDSFFHLQYKNCVNAFQTCVKATKQFEELSEFYSLCKSIGVGRTSEYPSVQTISEELIETLQEFLKDQSSFPAISKSPNRPLLLLPTAAVVSVSGRHDSYGNQSEFSITTEANSERNSEVGSQSASLEDLISATETGTAPAISIDLEAYPDQFEKDSQRDCTSRISDPGSAKSLPASTSIADLTSLVDWPEVNTNNATQDQQPDQEEKKGWDLVLIEAMTMSAEDSPNVTNSFNAFPEASNSSTQTLPNVANNFNAFPDVETPSTQPIPNETNNFNSFPGTTTQSSQPWPNVANSFNAFPETTTLSAQPLSNVANNFNIFPEAATPSTQSTKPLPANTFKAFPEAKPPPTQPLPNATKSFDSFPKSTIPSAQSLPDIFNNLNAFPQTTTSSMQPSPNLTDSFNRFQQKEEGQTANGLCGFPYQGQGQSIEENGQQEVSRTGWELALVETTQPMQSITNIDNTFNISTLDSLYDKPSEVPSHSNNPFLQATIELPATSNVVATTTASSTIEPTFLVDDMFSSVPSFQATLAVSTQNPNSIVQNENDPFRRGFSAISSEQMFNSYVSHQNTLHEQQLWLQNQNKIIEKHDV